MNQSGLLVRFIPRDHPLPTPEGFGLIDDFGAGEAIRLASLLPP